MHQGREPLVETARDRGGAEATSGERWSRREWSNAITSATAVLAESCSFSFRLSIDRRLRRSRLDIGQIKLGEIERQLVADRDGTGLVVPTGVWTVAVLHFQSERCGPDV